MYVNLCLILICLTGVSGRSWGRTGGRLVPRHDWGSACPRTNPRLDAWLHAQPEETWLPLDSLFDSFVFDLKKALDTHRFPNKAIDRLFSSESDIHPSCNGAWLEFGVYSGRTANQAAEWRTEHCPTTCPWVFGFDTFTGLPETWERWPGGTFKRGRFDMKGLLPKVGPTVRLVKGLFNESLPRHLLHQRSFGGDMPVSYLHIDCDLYSGTRDALWLLNDYIKAGTIILFDELVNYANYRNHELRALWEWLHVTGAKVAVWGMRGLKHKDYAMELYLDREILYGHQAVGMVVTRAPDPIPDVVMPEHLKWKPQSMRAQPPSGRT